MTIAETLQEFVADHAKTLGLPVTFKGEPFIAPPGPYIRCAIGSYSEKAAGIGKYAPLRVDGKLELELETLAGDGSENLSCLAERVAGIFPYGLGLDYEGPQGSGEIIFAAPSTNTPDADAGRVRITVGIGFYAILFPQKEINND